jgi:dTDP-4-amino-4,6-dideoxygalactose transaminase
MLARKIHFFKTFFTNLEIENILDTLKSGWLTTSHKTFQFENNFANYVGAKYAVALNSCTAALHLALESIGITTNDNVLVPAMTFTATAEVVRYLGAHPIFLDCDPQTRLVTPDIVSNAFLASPRAKAVIVVHFGGQAVQMMDENDEKGVLSICKKYECRVIEDAAHAFPTKRNEKMVGSFGDVTCFSFYSNKTITTGEGGMLVTDDEHIFNRAKIMRLHGINSDIWQRFTSKASSWEYDVIAPGFKYNMADLNAAIGLAQLERAEELRKGREFCCRFYDEFLSGIDCLELPKIQHSWEDHSCHLYPILILDNSPVTRNGFIELMASHGIGTSVHYKPLYRMTYYRDAYNLDPDDFPNSEYIWKRTVSLPVYYGLPYEDLNYICQTIRLILQR